MGKIKAGLETATIASAQGLAVAQTQVDRVLWGKTSRIYSATLNPNGSASTTATRREASARQTQQTVSNASNNATSQTAEQGRTGARVPNPLDYGLVPLLDILVAVDVCNIMNYLFSQIGGPTPKPRSTNPTATERALYDIQDRAAEIQKAIDTFYSFPDRLIGRFTDISYEESTPAAVNNQIGIDTTTQQQTQNYQQGNTPGANSSGIEAQKFNVFNLINYITTSVNGFLTTKDAEGNQILTPEDLELANQVPFLQQNLTIFTDYLNILNRYADYRSIPNDDVQRLLTIIDKIRAACIVIQNLDFRSPASFLALLPPSTVQAQFAQIQKLINPTRLIPTLTTISEAINSFGRYIQKAQSILATSQVFVRIGILIIKVFRIIIRILKKLPIPNKFTTAGKTTTFASITTKAENTLIDIEDVLAQVRSLLNVIVSFFRYIQVNTREVLARVNTLLNNLILCQNLQDSPAVTKLQKSVDNLTTLQTRVNSFLVNYAAKIDAQRTFGGYLIKVVEEELADEGVVNKRRRGVALDKNGVIAVASDLTFATDENIIVQEVRIKLISKGLVDPTKEAIIDPLLADVVTFLGDDDLINAGVTGDNFALASINADLQRNLDVQSQDRVLRRQTRAAMRAAQKQARQQIDILKRDNPLGTPTSTAQAVSGNAPARQENYEVRVFIGNQLTRIISVNAASVDEAIKLAKEKVDPDNQHPTWKYTAKKLR